MIGTTRQPRIAAFAAETPALSQPARPMHRGAAEMMIIALLILTSTVDFTRSISIGGVSGLGIATLFSCGLAWAMWLARPALPNNLLRILLPLLLFEFFCVGSLLWANVNMKSLQLLAMGLGFLAIILLVAREVESDPGMAVRLHKVMLIGSVIATLMYGESVAVGGIAGESWVGPRSFGLAALPLIAVPLSHWFNRGKSDHRYLIWAGVIAATVLASMSRTALVAAVAMFPLAIAMRGKSKNVIQAIIVLVAGGALFWVAVMTIEPLNHRFFGDDAVMKVGGVTINASGRTKMWATLLANVKGDWLFGKGVSASGELIDRYFPELGHPHNDYLRFYYDFGVVGLSLWGGFVIASLAAMYHNLRRSVRRVDADFAIHLAPIMALLAVAVSMVTDNSVSYLYVMLPLAVLIGCSLGKGCRTMLDDAAARPPVEMIPAQSIARGRWGIPARRSTNPTRNTEVVTP